MSTPSCTPAYHLSPSNRVSASKRRGVMSDILNSAKSPAADRNLGDLDLGDPPLLASHLMTPSELSMVRYGASFGYRGACV